MTLFWNLLQQFLSPKTSDQLTNFLNTSHFPPPAPIPNFTPVFQHKSEDLSMLKASTSSFSNFLIQLGFQTYHNNFHYSNQRPNSTEMKGRFSLNLWLNLWTPFDTIVTSSWETSSSALLNPYILFSFYLTSCFFSGYLFLNLRCPRALSLSLLFLSTLQPTKFKYHLSLLSLTWTLPIQLPSWYLLLDSC